MGLNCLKFKSADRNQDAYLVHKMMSKMHLVGAHCIHVSDLSIVKCKEIWIHEEHQIPTLRMFQVEMLTAVK